jgi:hypothetical protein
MRQAKKTSALTLLFAISSEGLPRCDVRRREFANGRMTEIPFGIRTRAGCERA